MEIMGYSSFSSVKAICLLVFILIGSVSSLKGSLSANKICPFDYLFHLGDGVFDNGNAIATKPDGRYLPAARFPYGMTTPGYPTGRWSDGLLDIDIGAIAMGFPELTPYLGGNASYNDAIIFAVGRSPVLDRSFWAKQCVSIPPFVAPLTTQMSWLKRHLKDISSCPEDLADKAANSLFLFGDVEGNDITYPLLQGKSIQQVKKYVPFVTKAQIDAAKELIKLGATRVILPGNVPIGCYPFVLTALKSYNPLNYDSFGCLKKVNDLIVYKNNDLKSAIDKLKIEYPNTTIFYADFYDGFQTLLKEVLAGPNKDLALKTCCGSGGGKYNYNSIRFCGSRGAFTCADPSKYIYWDGIHLTQQANDRLSQILQVDAKSTLGCNTDTYSSADYMRIKGMNDADTTTWSSGLSSVV